MTPADFLAAHGFGAAERVPVPADASFRRYERLIGGPVPALLMLCPPGREPIAPFLRIAAHLRGLGLSAPEVYFADETAGLALIEDLGEDTFTALLARGEDVPYLAQREAERLRAADEPHALGGAGAVVAVAVGAALGRQQAQVRPVP